MIALELSGAHIGSTLRVTYRRQSWKKDVPDAVWTNKLYCVRHDANNRITINYGSYQSRLIVPWNAEVELLDEVPA
jgi:hypothetical protein